MTCGGSGVPGAAGWGWAEGAKEGQEQQDQQEQQGETQPPEQQKSNMAGAGRRRKYKQKHAAAMGKYLALGNSELARNGIACEESVRYVVERATNLTRMVKVPASSAVAVARTAAVVALGAAAFKAKAGERPPLQPAAATAPASGCAADDAAGGPAAGGVGAAAVDSTAGETAETPATAAVAMQSGGMQVQQPQDQQLHPETTTSGQDRARPHTPPPAYSPGTGAATRAAAVHPAYCSPFSPAAAAAAAAATAAAWAAASPPPAAKGGAATASSFTARATAAAAKRTAVIQAGMRRAKHAKQAELLDMLRKKLKAQSYTMKRGLNLEAQFRRMDRDSSGSLTTKEMAACLRVYGVLGAKEIADLVGHMDADGDGMVDIAEFVDFIDDA